MNVVIIKYNAGNIQSVLFALERMGIAAVVSDDINVIRSADKLIFPGVGEASSAMAYLKEKGLDIIIRQCTQPLLGICLGMQLLCSISEEAQTECLGIFDHTVKKFIGTEKIPQMGWNNIYHLQSPLFNQVPENSFLYFVHSYYASIGTNTAATTDYIIPFSSALQKDNFYGVQFHPEKSGDTGALILKNFISL